MGFWGLMGRGLAGAGKGAWWLASKTAEKVGQGSMWAGKKAVSAAPRVADKVGTATINGAENAFKFGVKTTNIPNAVNPLSHLNMAQQFAGKMVQYKEGSFVKDAAGKVTKEIEGRYRTTWLGKGVLATGGLAYGAHDAMSTMQESRMGYGDQMMMTATPNNIPDNGGATGDLVFAMNRNRRG